MSSPVIETKCVFCKTSSKCWPVNSGGIIINGFDCTICKTYFISADLADEVVKQDISLGLLNCISENIKTNSKTSPITYWHRNSAKPLPKLPPETAIKSFNDHFTIPINHAEKPNALLEQIAKLLELKRPFDRVQLGLKQLYEIKILDTREATFWAQELDDKKFISLAKHMGATEVIASMTPAGWQKVFKDRQSLNSKKVFIAMQFNWPDAEEIKNQFIEAVKLGCLDCGYEADIVPQHHLEPITDKIIAGIKSSRFVVADFTFNNRGAYYEAGFARGFGIPVIHTIMDGHQDGDPKEGKRLHFDIQQINYLKWSDPKEVREKIRDRIQAVIEKKNGHVN